VNTGLRISDLLRLKVKDVRNKSVIYLVMEKTDKELAVPLNPYIQGEIIRYTDWKKDKDYLFTSREGVNKPLTRQMVSQVIKEAAEALGFDEKINTHTMRKTFGYWYYKEKKDVYFLMKLFGHNTQSQTLEYIGIETEEISKSLEDFSL
jgi:site-specific recombinase XerD